MSEYVIKAISYSKPRMIPNPNGEYVAGRYGVTYTVGQMTEIASLGFRKVSEIIYSKEIKGFEVHFNEVNKAFPCKGLITVPFLSDTEVYYQIEEK